MKYISVQPRFIRAGGFWYCSSSEFMNYQIHGNQIRNRYYLVKNDICLLIGEWECGSYFNGSIISALQLIIPGIGIAVMPYVDVSDVEIFED